MTGTPEKLTPEQVALLKELVGEAGVASSGSLPLKDLLEAYAAAKLQKIHIQNYAGANLAYIHALDMMKKLGVDKTASERLGIQPFPGSTRIENVGNTTAPPSVPPAQEAPQEQPKPTPKPSVGDSLKSKAAKYALALATGGALTYGITKIPDLFSSPETPPPSGAAQLDIY